MDCEAALRKEPRVVWTEAETLYLLKVFKEHNVVELLEGKKYRQNGIFEIVHDKMVEAGFQRSTEQVITKWKSLKVAYYSARKHNKDDGYLSIPYGQTLHDLLGHRTPSKRRRNSEYASEDQDQSLADYDPEMDFTNADMESSPDDVTQSPRSDDFAKPQFSRETPSEHVTPKPRRGRPVVKGSNTDKLLTFIRELKEAQSELQEKLMREQRECWEREMEKQRQWEANLLRQQNEQLQALTNSNMVALHGMLNTLLMRFAGPSHFHNQAPPHQHHQTSPLLLQTPNNYPMYPNTSVNSMDNSHVQPHQDTNNVPYVDSVGSYPAYKPNDQYVSNHGIKHEVPQHHIADPVHSMQPSN